jgi:hypothetical protein
MPEVVLIINCRLVPSWKTLRPNRLSSYARRFGRICSGFVDLRCGPRNCCKTLAHERKATNLSPINASLRNRARLARVAPPAAATINDGTSFPIALAPPRIHHRPLDIDVCDVGQAARDLIRRQARSSGADGLQPAAAEVGRQLGSFLLAATPSPTAISKSRSQVSGASNCRPQATTLDPPLNLQIGVRNLTFAAEAIGTVRRQLLVVHGS